MILPESGAPILIDLAVLMLVCLYGLALGSFATALIYRIPRDIPWIINRSSDDLACRSRCTSCGNKLGVLDLVPLFSWLFSGGKCRQCGAHVSAFYPLTELACMVLTLALFWVWGFTASALPLYFAIPFLLAAFVIDWRHMILPDSINVSLLVLASIYVGITWMESGWDWLVPADNVSGATFLVFIFAVVSFILSKWKGRSALGQGDLKFLVPAGLFLGVAPLPSFLALSGAAGIVTSLIFRKHSPEGAFPFGPALIISLFIHLFLTGLGFDYKW